MATHFNEASKAALPFMLVGKRADAAELDFSSALKAAVAAELADETSRRNSRGRIAYILCELGSRLDGRKRNGGLLLSRAGIANVSGISLCRVKRALALLALSQVIAIDGRRIRVLNWRRLSGVAGYDRARLGIGEDDGEVAFAERDEDQPEANSHTISGDPACFV